MRYKYVFLGYLLVFFITSGVYSFTVPYLVQRHDIGLNYNNVRILPILISKKYSMYYYEINIDGKRSNSFLKVILVDKNLRPLDNPFSYVSGKDVILVWNNKVKEYKEVYLLLDYYSPLSQNKVFKVRVNIYPYFSHTKGKEENIRPLSHVLPSLYYEFNIHLNAYLGSFSTSSSTPSYRTTAVYNKEYVSSNGENGINVITNTTMNSGNTFEDIYVVNKTNTSVEKESNLSTITRRSTTQKRAINNFSFVESNNKSSFLPTGKIIGNEKGVRYNTYLIFIIGSVGLYLLWRLV